MGTKAVFLSYTRVDISRRNKTREKYSHEFVHLFNE